MYLNKPAGCIRYVILLIACGSLLCAAGGKALAQVSGLGFYSYGNSKDQRTGLDLTAGSYFQVKEKTELSFRFTLRANEKHYFGYVFRLLAENGSIDLIYNHNGIYNTSLAVVQGQKVLITVKTNFADLCADWKELRFIFDTDGKKLTFILPDSSYTAGGLSITKGEKARLSFGVCNYENYRTTDVPPMNIKDIRISENNRLIHNWPLNELEGNTAADIKGSMDASVAEPMWLKSEHHNWKEVLDLETEGNVKLAFDPENEDLIIAGPAEILRFSVGNNSLTHITPKNQNLNFLPQRQAVYDPVSDLLYCLEIDRPSVTVFDFKSETWSGILDMSLKDADFLHHNKYLSAADSSVYLFGGYGHHKYKNLVQRYNLNDNSLETLQTSGDFFSPRYLAASGYLNDTIFILGGFGSTSGEQILNPHSYNDLVAYSLKNRSFAKILEIPSPEEDFAYANSMVINPADRSYYVLGFPILKYNGYLQLIKGSLDKPGITSLGSQIPYQFLDIVSYSDLFFCRQNGKLLAVTLLNEEGKSRIRIYTLAFPPDSLKEGFAAAASDRRLLKYAIIVLVCFLILAGIHLFVRRKNKQSETISTNTVESSKAVHQSPAPRGEICHVNFFGDFQIVNSAGTDITRKFTPLLKELFLLIWFNSIRNDMGISNEKITDILWHGFSESSANNNKAVNIAKLRAILTKELWCDLSYKETGYWKIDYKCRNVINDYYEFIRITSSKQELSKPDVLRLIEFAIKGPLLKDLKYKWLDEFRVAVSNEMIARLVRYVRTLVIKDNPEHVIRVADAILNYDGVNEEAMENKCKSLISLGRHSVAKEVYDHYAGEYKALYGEAYSKSFSTIANQPS
ncbi:MAG: hypothetical protein MUE32_01240 [Bacteroidales bacterium]|jgi:two-component SAPR family response regulator|nr:hypothetical protein [Bacteroidales bacterium]